MRKTDFKMLKNACYASYLAMSSVFCLPAMLFVTFHNMYGISYTLLGTLVLINFCTQLLVDLLFTFFPKLFNIKLSTRLMPVIISIGLGIYAMAPILFKDNVYFGLVTGTVIFSIASGLSEVLLSPLIASIPDSTAKDMSMLHSLFAVGVVLTVGISTIFLNVLGNEKWQILTLFWAIVPVIPCVLFCLSPFPQMSMAQVEKSKNSKQQKFILMLCVFCIFLGSAAENTMTNWISSYMENALGINKSVGDILGMAVFAVLLGLGRVLHAKYGKNIFKILTLSMAGAVVCYLIAGLSTNVVLSFSACILTGFCTAMLWPGSLILMEEKIKGVGVAAYALMAAGGDFGASVSPQLVGIVIDEVNLSDWAITVSQQMNISIEQLSMKVGMLVASLFPILGTILLLYMKKYFKHNKI